MGFKMRDLNQEIIKFDYSQNFTDDDFYVSKSNKHIFDLLKKWPKWEKNFLNISGEKFSGKSHLINIFLKKFNGIKLESSLINNDHLRKIKGYQNIVLENLDQEIKEDLFFALCNIIEHKNKFLIFTFNYPIFDVNFILVNLKS